MIANRRTFNARHVESKAEQRENAALLYTLNYAAELDTDTISTSTWNCEDSGLTIANEANTTQTAAARLSGDVGRYRVVNKIVTSGGDTLERYIDLTIRDNTRYYHPDYGWSLSWR